MPKVAEKSAKIEDVSAYYQAWSAWADWCYNLALQPCPDDPERHRENVRRVGEAIAAENRERDRVLERLLGTWPRPKSNR